MPDAHHHDVEPVRFYVEHIDPTKVRHVVLSVPHSGTRTLQQWLKQYHNITRGTDPDPDEMPGHWHFGMHEQIGVYESEGVGQAHVPLRNPLNVTDSWHRRYSNDVDKFQHFVHQAMRLMIEFIDRNEDRVTIYKMEDLPVLRGVMDDAAALDMDCERIQQLIKYFRTEPFVREFYQAYYSEDELRWI